MAARWSRFLQPRNSVISSCSRLLGRSQTHQQCRTLSGLYLRSVCNELGWFSKPREAAISRTRRSVTVLDNKPILQEFSTSTQKYDGDIETDQHIDYKSIPSLLRESLVSRGHGPEILQVQIDILDKLIQFRDGEEKVDAVKELTDKFGEDAIATSLPLFWFASLAGNTDAKYSYAKLLQTGQGVDPDPIEAAKLFKELSEKGHPFAQFSLAQMYYAGVGVEQDFKNAVDLYEISATNGILPAYTLLGNMYRTGQGIEENHNKAFEMYQEGAEKGDVSALMAIAYCYSHGQGVEIDHNKSFEYHKLAADKGYPSAQYNIGVHYFAGRGVASVDMKMAAEYFQLSANQGFELAQINLGNMYYNGLGVDKDLEKARQLYQQAAKNNPNAKLLLEELESEINKTVEKTD